MKYKFNSYAIFSIGMLGMFYSTLWDMVGNIPKVQTAPNTWKEMVLVGFVILVIWFAGYKSKFGYDKSESNKS